MWCECDRAEHAQRRVIEDADGRRAVASLSCAGAAVANNALWWREESPTLPHICRLFPAGYVPLRVHLQMQRSRSTGHTKLFCWLLLLNSTVYTVFWVFLVVSFGLKSDVWYQLQQLALLISTSQEGSTRSIKSQGTVDMGGVTWQICRRRSDRRWRIR